MCELCVPNFMELGARPVHVVLNDPTRKAPSPATKPQQPERKVIVPAPVR